MRGIDMEDPALLRDLEHLYGFTDNPERGGWILPDGRMLDTTPRPDREGSPHRCHYSIGRLGRTAGTSEDEARTLFVDAGLIRHVIGHTAFELGRSPTAEQLGTMAGVIQFFHGGPILLDLRHRGRSSSMQVPIGQLAQAFIEIRRFFELAEMEDDHESDDDQ